jgi:hypothetical protein
MPKVQASAAFPGSVHEAETCWYDTARWPWWVDGVQTVEHVDPGWPAVGATVTWVSGSAGRGRVTERVVAYTELEGLTIETDEEQIKARQQVSFTPADGNVEVSVSLAWEYRRRSFSTLLGALFIRGAFASSLQTTLTRFGAELSSKRSLSDH